MKRLKRIFFISFASATVVITALIASVFLFKDKIIKEFIREANKSLNTPIKVGKIDVSILENFPRLSLVLRDVYVEDSHRGEYPLLTAKTISFQLDLLGVYQGDYTINGLKIEDSEANLKISRQGENNYNIIKGTSEEAQGGKVKVNLRNVSLVNTVVHYSDLKLDHDLDFSSNELMSTISIHGDIYLIEAKGDLLTNQIKIEKNAYFNEKLFNISANIEYDDANKRIAIKPSVLNLNKATFAINGTYDWAKRNLIEINTTGENTDIQTLISLLPASASNALVKYESKGDVYFNSKLKGEISSTVSPSLTVDFGFRNATLFHPDYNSKIEEAQLEGSFASSDVSKPRYAALVLKNMSGRLNSQSFTGNFIIQDFDDPKVICDFKGKLNAESVLDFYPVKELKNLNGDMSVDIAFNGRLALLKDKNSAQQVSTQGTIDLENISFDYGEQKIPFRSLNGNLQFSNNDLALSNVSGKLGNSDFLMNGFFKNVITFLLFEDQPIGIEADLVSRYIDLNQLFSISFGDASSDLNQEYIFELNKNVSLNFNCDVKQLRYKKFFGSNLKGDLLIKNEMAVSRNLSLKTMGGKLELSGILDAQNPKAIDLVSTARLDGIHLDSAFYVFENFQQNFIEAKHLKGEVTADVMMEMTLNQNLKLLPQTLIADIGSTIRNGQLNQFEPMQKLKKFLDDEGLSKLRFAELRNEIHIENKTVFIPQMEIRSNVTSLTLSGTHTFDQQINYRIITPFKRRRVADPESMAAVEEDKTGAKLFLKITGTTDNYRIAYDTEAVRKKISNDLKREVQELKDAFKSKGKKKQKEVELEKDDYFDW